LGGDLNAPRQHDQQIAYAHFQRINAGIGLHQLQHALADGGVGRADIQLRCRNRPQAVAALDGLNFDRVDRGKI